MNYLTFDISDNDEGVITIEAMAATGADRHAVVMAEVKQLLDWAWREFPHSHGAADDGMDWDHDLQVRVEDAGWHAVTLTLTGSEAFAKGFRAAYGHLLE